MAGRPLITASMALRRLRLAREHGFTMVEMLIVLIVIGALLAIAVPSRPLLAST